VVKRRSDKMRLLKQILGFGDIWECWRCKTINMNGRWRCGSCGKIIDEKDRAVITEVI